MKKFLATVLAILTVLSMSACTSVTETEQRDIDGNLKGYVRATLSTMSEYCTKLEFLDADKNVMQVIEAEAEGIHYRWSLLESIGPVRVDTPMFFDARDYPTGIAHISVWDYENKCFTGKEYVTFPYSGIIMEELDMAERNGAWFFTSAKVYNPDGSVKFSYASQEGCYFVVAMTIDNGNYRLMIREYNADDVEIRYSLYEEGTYSLISSDEY